MNRKKLLLECLTGLVLFKDRFAQVKPDQVTWICERLAWHKILPLAAALNDPIQTKCAELEKVFEAVSMENAAREAYYEKQGALIFETFENAGIDFIPFKGPFWAQQIYPHYAWRHIGDIDLLFTKKNAQAASEILQKMGYVCQHSPERTFAEKGEFALYPDTDIGKRVPVELHWEILPSPRFIKRNFLYPEDFFSNYSIANWNGFLFRLPSKEIQLLYHLLHATCQHQFKRFVHIINIAHFIRKIDINWKIIEKLAHQRGIKAPLYFGLKIVNCYASLPHAAHDLIKNLSPSLNVRLLASMLTPASILFLSHKHGGIRRKLFRLAMSW